MRSTLSVFGRRLYPIDHEDLDWPASRVQSQSKLFLQCTRRPTEQKPLRTLRSPSARATEDTEITKAQATEDTEFTKRKPPWTLRSPSARATEDTEITKALLRRRRSSRLTGSPIASGRPSRRRSASKSRSRNGDHTTTVIYVSTIPITNSTRRTPREPS